MGVQAEDQIERLFFRRLNRLVDVRRFIVTWILLLVLLIGGLVAQTRGLTNYYQKLSPVPGGTYTEGIIGSYTNANPLYATDAVDSAVSRLIFSGLLKYDKDNHLVGDLADKWAVDEREVKYTFHLRPNITWHDGTPFTSEDVVFTYKTIQNADAKSPLFTSWQRVVIEAPSPRTVVFTLPSALSSFPNSLTNGIVPKHLLAATPANQLRSIRFNSIDPVGTGPFRFERVEVTGITPEARSEQIALSANENYHSGPPKLQRYVIRSYHNESQLIDALKRQELNGAAGLSSLSDELRTLSGVHAYNVPLTGEVLVFFKTTSEVLQDVKVRQALIKATDQNDIVANLGYPVISARGPFLASHLGYNKDLVQFTKNIDEAKKLLDDAGWKLNGQGIRQKDNKTLSFRLYAQNRNEYAYVTQKLQMQWREIGVQAEVLLQPDSELQTTVANHAYDALLYGISLGVDPDTYAYWHSSQADVRSLNRLNFAEYKSTAADKALEAGRSRSDPALRTIKYRPFLESWRNDAPAIALYQPRFLYITRGELFGFDGNEMNSATDRFSNVDHWMVRQAKVNK
jgi:peptide/nickel transport system substrate-binding protein